MTTAVLTERRRAERLPAAIRALRPRQWTKNLLLFAGLLFAGRLDDVSSWLAATTAFAAFCLVSSACYLLNDLHDVDADRLHPTKRLRPIAAGELGRRRAVLLAELFAPAGLVLGAVLGWETLALLGGFATVQLAYTFGLKRLAFIDVLVIAGLFVLRAAAGAAAIGVRISPWLLVCTSLLALFLALTKRRAELARVEAGQSAGREALERYSLPLADRLVHAAGFATIGAYALYAFQSPKAAMALTIPLVGVGVCRYLFLTQYRELGEEPEQVLLSDAVVIGAVLCWVALAAALLAKP
jgi:4-hydroxybenzoate polyprenyltransferase